MRPFLQYNVILQCFASCLASSEVNQRRSIALHASPLWGLALAAVQVLALHTRELLAMRLVTAQGRC